MKKSSWLISGAFSCLDLALAGYALAQVGMASPHAVDEILAGRTDARLTPPRS